VQVNGRVASMLEVGTGFHSELTGRENVYLSGAILGMSRAEICRRFDEIVAFSGVEEFIDVPVKRYSSGMYVRLAFAVAAHIQTDILIVDEVLAVGDLDFQRKCLGKMGEAGKSGRTVLFVSHNMPAVRRLCHRTMMLHQGCMEAVGATDEVVSRYMSANTAGQDAEVALPPAVGGEGGWASRLRLHAEDGTPRTRFPLGAAWCATIEFEVCRAMEHVIAGVGLVTADGIPLATYWSRPRDLPAGRYAVGFRCQLPLAATSLLVSVGLSAQERPFYYAEGVAKVEVCDVAEGEQPLRARGAGILLTSDAPDIRTL
jgi:lipopolysaccharide transport system ATP-binding protein